MIYFTSDWHIGHNKPFLYEPRGFSSIEEHDKEVLKRCNELVKPEDTLWILGDLAMGGDMKEWNMVYCNLACQNLHFIQGNHDTDNKMDIYAVNYGFEYHGFAEILKYNKKKTFYLSHYPTIVNNFGEEKKKFIACLFGHTHQKEKFYNNNPYMYHVGLDSHNCYPVSIETIIKDIENFKEKIGENK